MFTDIRVSEGLNTKFHNEFLKAGEELNVSFSIYVLQTGAWPLGSSPVSSFVIPKQLIPCIQYVGIFNFKIYIVYLLFNNQFIYISLKSSTKGNLMGEN